ncbi:hypothetical protein PGT21_033771 [Puccinia graminis f. sp. tritici]|uniref:Uncharacterized protein n=1 Tax=Puccinia graminis f. sp. tritici TaxID=56615 RepID=A0A5B0N827_PUCGR|nr:hypothetical protein PGTUg99_009260 [Puccinia graminis f. sp. tritici]KAA1084663.1 hypothetical protein PGT21_033771 [Puccinia graminis f. sp. tritici]
MKVAFPWTLFLLLTTLLGATRCSFLRGGRRGSNVGPTLPAGVILDSEAFAGREDSHQVPVPIGGQNALVFHISETNWHVRNDSAHEIVIQAHFQGSKGEQLSKTHTITRGFGGSLGIPKTTRLMINVTRAGNIEH